MKTQEIECRFLEINKEELIKKLISLGAKDCGEAVLDEMIVYDSELRWLDEKRYLRLRKAGDNVTLTYKEHQASSVDGAFEIELKIDDFEKGQALVKKIGLTPFRRQQKKRHTLVLNGVNFDIDTWPQIPTYVELEGESESELKEAAKLAGLDWSTAEFHDAKWVIENVYKIPVGKFRLFTFDKIE